MYSLFPADEDSLMSKDKEEIYRYVNGEMDRTYQKAIDKKRNHE